MFHIYWKGEHPKPKKVFHKGGFPKRQQARNWCRNHQYLYEDLTIVHPDGNEEKFIGL